MMLKLSCPFLFLIMFLACKKEKSLVEDSDVLNKEKVELTEGYVPTKEDTILEKNNPKSLDFSKHQMFIDTTRNSRFFKEIIVWKKSELYDDLIKSSLEYHQKGTKLKTFNLPKIPIKFVSLRKLNGEFILYSRCNGIDTRYEISDNALLFLGPLEVHAELITSVLVNTENRMKLELRTYAQISPDKKGVVEIRRINDLVYKLTYESYSYNSIKYITPIEKVKEFDLIVNFCPNEMMPEFYGFDDQINDTSIIEVQ